MHLMDFIKLEIAGDRNNEQIRASCFNRYGEDCIPGDKFINWLRSIHLEQHQQPINGKVE